MKFHFRVSKKIEAKWKNYSLKLFTREEKRKGLES